GKLYGDADAAEAGVGGKYVDLGVHTIEPIMARGVLLDVPKALGVDMCEPGYEITVDDLERAEKQTGVSVRSGDVVLIRSGWGKNFDKGTEAYVGKDSGVPGVSQDGAQWLAARDVHAAGADTIAFECLPPGGG